MAQDRTALSPTVYQSATIYYASGTGNSYRAAGWFHQACLDRGMDSQLVPIEQAQAADEILATPEHLVVLAFPAHGLMPPWSMIKFLFRMPFKPTAHVFTLPTRGSFWIGSWPIPGAAGLGSFIPTLLLAPKAYRSRGATSLDMPINMTSVHPPLGEAKARKLIQRTKGIAQRRIERVLSGRSTWFTWNHLWELVWSVPLLVFVPIFPILYLLLGRFFMGKLHFASNACTGCASCARGCPCQAITMLGQTNKRPHWSYSCESCLRCLNTCKHRAVQAGLSWGVLLWLVMTMSLSVYLFPLIQEHLPRLASLHWYARELVFSVYYYAVVVVAYWIFSLALRLKPINWFFTHSTLSHYIGRYLEPETTRKNLLRGERKGSRQEPDES